MCFFSDVFLVFLFFFFFISFACAFIPCIILIRLKSGNYSEPVHLVGEKRISHVSTIDDIEFYAI